MKRKIDFCTECSKCSYCKHWPYHLQYKMLRCNTPKCAGGGKKYPSIDAWNKAQKKIVLGLINICREMGITREGI